MIAHVLLNLFFLALSAEHFDERLCFVLVQPSPFMLNCVQVIDDKGGLNQVCILDSHVADYAVHFCEQICGLFARLLPQPLGKQLRQYSYEVEHWTLLKRANVFHNAIHQGGHKLLRPMLHVVFALVVLGNFAEALENVDSHPHVDVADVKLQRVHHQVEQCLLLPA